MRYSRHVNGLWPTSHSRTGEAQVSSQGTATALSRPGVAGQRALNPIRHEVNTRVSTACSIGGGKPLNLELQLQERHAPKAKVGYKEARFRVIADLGAVSF